MTTEGDRPPETPDNFAGTPDLDPESDVEHVSDLPRGWRPNPTLTWVMLASLLVAVVLGAALVYTA